MSEFDFVHSAVHSVFNLISGLGVAYLFRWFGGFEFYELPRPTAMQTLGIAFLILLVAP